MHKRSALRIYIINGLFVLGLFVNTSAQAQNPFPFVLPWDDDSAGITNFRALNHQPAGKYGPVTTGADGHLYVGTQRIRFLGVNLTGKWCFPPIADAPAVAARMAKFGINLVRCHLLDAGNFPNGIFIKDGTGTRQLDPQALQRLDYFISVLKLNGIYVNLNLLAGRPFKAADGLPAEMNSVGWPLQNFMAIFYPPMIELQKEFQTQLLKNHINSSTGISYAEDPAIAFLEINNERGLIEGWKQGYLAQIPAVFINNLTQQWNEWLTTQYGTSAQLKSAWGADGALGPEMLTNGDFSLDTSNWFVQISNPATANVQAGSESLPTGVTGKSLCLNVTQAGTAGWHVQFMQTGLSVKADEPYTFSFWAKADQARTISTALINQDTYHWLGFGEMASLSPSWQRYTFTLWPTSTDSRGRLEFSSMGLQAGGRFCFAGTTLRSGGVAGLQENEQLENGSVALFTTRANFLGRTRAAQRDWVRFLRDVENSYYQTINAHLKTTLGARAVVMGTQVGYSPVNVMAKLGAVDKHAYWQHPLVRSNTDWSLTNKSMVNERGGTIPEIGLFRALDKPMSVSEYNHASPNTYSSEAYLMLAAYAALQDWDAIYAYSYWGHNDPNWNLAHFYSWFNINQHPEKMATLLAASAMFLRGDVAPAQQQIVAPIGWDQENDLLRTTLAQWVVDARRVGVPREAALIHRVAIATEGQTVPAGALTPAQAAPLGDPNNKIFTSDTGQLNWDVTQTDRGVLTINTAKSKAVIGYGGGKSFNLGGVIIEPGTGLQNGWSTITATAVQGDFTTENRLLITTTGYTENTGMVWNADKSSLISTDPSANDNWGNGWGVAPSLVEGVPARITLPLPPQGVAAWALDERGQRKAPLNVTTGNGTNSIIAIGPEHQTLWYEVQYVAADLSVALSSNSSSAFIDDNLTYTLTVTNKGPSRASAVILMDTLPSGLSYVSSTGACSGTSTISCNLGSLANGSTASVTITAKATTPGVKTNTASVSNGPEPDPNSSNNSITARTTVLPSCATGNYQITGAVRKNSSSGSRLGGVTLRLSAPGCGQVTTTNTRDNYTFTNLKSATYTITPNRTGCTFNPPNHQVTVNNRNRTVSGWSKTGFAGSGASCN